MKKSEIESLILTNIPDAKIEIVPMVSSGIIKINGINPNTYIDSDNDSFWVIESERRSSWSEKVPEDNLIVKGEWWDLSRPNQLQISLDAKVAKDFNVNLEDEIIKKSLIKKV